MKFWKKHAYEISLSRLAIILTAVVAVVLGLLYVRYLVRPANLIDKPERLKYVQHYLCYLYEESDDGVTSFIHKKNTLYWKDTPVYVRFVQENNDPNITSAYLSLDPSLLYSDQYERHIRVIKMAFDSTNDVKPLILQYLAWDEPDLLMVWNWNGRRPPLNMADAQSRQLEFLIDSSFEYDRSQNP